MFAYLKSFLLSLLLVPTALQAQVPAASDAFMRVPAMALDLLNTPMRREMIANVRGDTVTPVLNAMEGFSEIVLPLTDTYLQARVTPVTLFTLRVLPTAKDAVVATSYTVGDTIAASDSELRFYDSQMQPLKREKFIKTAQSKDFLDLSGLSGAERDELLELIPFPTVEYSFNPDNTDLTATLTVGTFMGEEDMARLAPRLTRTRTYRWTGKKYEMVK